MLLTKSAETWRNTAVLRIEQLRSKDAVEEVARLRDDMFAHRDALSDIQRMKRASVSHEEAIRSAAEANERVIALETLVTRLKAEADARVGRE